MKSELYFLNMLYIDYPYMFDNYPNKTELANALYNRKWHYWAKLYDAGYQGDNEIPYPADLTLKNIEDFIELLMSAGKIKFVEDHNKKEPKKNSHNYIKIWKFQDSPKKLAALSTNGGDEDWLALVPPNLADTWMPWLTDNEMFGCPPISKYEHPDYPEHIIYIGCHA